MKICIIILAIVFSISYVAKKLINSYIKNAPLEQIFLKANKNTTAIYASAFFNLLCILTGTIDLNLIFIKIIEILFAI